MNLHVFLEENKTQMNVIEQQFIEDIYYPYAGENGLDFINVQTPIVDNDFKKRKLDFTIQTNRFKYVIEIDGYTYHAEGALRVSEEYFDDLLNKQNDLILNGWIVLRFSYNQIRTSPNLCMDTLRRAFKSDPQINPYYLNKNSFEPTYPQQIALDNIASYRERNISNGVVIMPTGLGKTIVAALDAKRYNKKTLFIVHRNDILRETFEKFNLVWPESTKGFFNSEEKDISSDIIFASKDTLYKDGNLQMFNPDSFDLIIIDEVHHSACNTYKKIIDYFSPSSMIGLTATPERQDRADILELFDYNIFYEMHQREAIESGYLTGFIYHGLKDDIDYSKIKHNGIKYDVADLGRKLNIEKRNLAIFNKYQSLTPNKKAIGFCVNIEHAISMAEFFNKHGVPSQAIHSNKSLLTDDEKSAYIQDFKDNNLQILFTVDMFNEGVDFPDVEALLFLRPTESKTIFIQQLGRGLRLNPYKNHVYVLDFIGNFKNANNIKNFLKGHSPSNNNGNANQTGSSNKRFGTKEFLDWPLGCEVHFEESVEELFSRIENASKEISKQDLIDNYYEVKEHLKKKPTPENINDSTISNYSLSQYRNLFKSWSKFLIEIGEATKASYHYPQGTHLGHIFYVIKTIGDKSYNNLISPNIYSPSEGETLTKIGRQTRYKIWACMELGLLYDDRNPSEEGDNVTFTHLTKDGLYLYDILNQYVTDSNFYAFEEKKGLTWEMVNESNFNTFIKNLPIDVKNNLEKIFFKMDAVQHMLKYLLQENKNAYIFSRQQVYLNYFNTPIIKDYCEMNGIEPPSEEGSKRRLPFILNILEAFGVISFVGKSEFKTVRIPLYNFLFNDSAQLDVVKSYYSDSFDSKVINSEMVADLKTLFGKDFLTEKYTLKP